MLKKENPLRSTPLFDDRRKGTTLSPLSNSPPLLQVLEHDAVEGLLVHHRGQTSQQRRRNRRTKRRLLFSLSLSLPLYVPPADPSTKKNCEALITSRFFLSLILFPMSSAPAPGKPTRIVDLRPSLQAVSVQFIVLERGTKTKKRLKKHSIVASSSVLFRSPFNLLLPPSLHQLRQPGETTSFRKMEGGVPVDVQTSTARVADATACVTLALTGADECGGVGPGDVFRLCGGLFTLDKQGRAALRAGRRGTLERLGFGDFVFAEGPDMSSVGYEREETGSGGSGGGYRPRAPLPTKFWQPPSLCAPR